MAITKLRALLTKIESSSGALSVGELARDLDLSRERVENMMEYWVRKGKVRTADSAAECGTCVSSDDCPFVFEMPKTYELVDEKLGEIVYFSGPACK